MTNLDVMKSISIATRSKIVVLVIDGLGGLPEPGTGKTELETANTPNLDRLAERGICGLSDPVSPGITPGSAPGHLGIFGYDPLVFNIGRGALEVTGIDFELQPGDVAVRGNFCTMDEAGRITDRRAGRISQELCVELSRLLDGMRIGDTQVIVRPVKEHRFGIVFRGGDLSPAINDTDSQQTGVPPRPVSASSPEGERMVGIVSQFVEKAKGILADRYPTNMILLRGFAEKPQIPGIGEVYKLRPAAIASYPMYRGLARLVGMDVLATGINIEDEFKTLVENYGNYDYFFVHIKGSDAAGEDGDFQRKVKVIEQVDQILPVMLRKQPEVIVVTGDHSTPALLKSHSWHPVPLLLYSQWCRKDAVREFSESACISGGLGRIAAKEIMALAMGNAMKLTKYGA
jgi:2,3-bisphosphoglycerate-independent phosphoglycerate mutase